MAANVSSGGRLPPDFNYGVTRDGRVFFIDERRKDTTWLHPLNGRPVQTGFYTDPGLPDGWEQAVTLEGTLYYIDHNTRTTSFQHPVTGRAVHIGNTSPKSFPQNVSAQNAKHPTSPQSPTNPQSPTSPGEKNFKRNQAKQRSLKAPSAKRNPNSRVIRRAWLYRWETGGLTKSWKKRWCVLVDFALFIYKDEHEENAVTSVLLPSYRINMVLPTDPVFRQYAFKLEHENTKTLYFATDSTSDLENWVSLLRQEAMMKGQKGFTRETNNNKPQRLIPKSPIISRNNDASDDEPLFPGSLHLQDPGGYRRLQRDEDIEPPDSRVTASYPGYSDNNPSHHPDQNDTNSQLPPRDRDSYSAGRSRNSRDLTPAYNQDRPREYDGRYGDPERQANVEHPEQMQNVDPRDSRYQPGSNLGDPSEYPSHRTNGNNVPHNNYPSDMENRDRYRENHPDYGDPQHNEGYGQDKYNSMPRQGVDGNQPHPQEPTSFLGRQKRINPSYFDGDEHSGRAPQDVYSRDGESRDHPYEGYGPSLSEEAQDAHGPGMQAGNYGDEGLHRERSSRASDQPAFDNYQGHLPPDGQHGDRSSRASDRLQNDGYHGDRSSRALDRPPFDGYHGDRSSRASDHHPPYDGYHGDRSSRASDHPQFDGYHGDRSSRTLDHPPYNSHASHGAPGYNHDNPDNREHGGHSSSMPQLNRQGVRQHPELTVTIPHTYVNFPSDTDSGDHDSSGRRQEASPGRPPYPVSVRQQIAQEIAETKTPHTSNDYVTSVKNEKKRMQQREYFQYPTPLLQPDQSYPQNSPDDHNPRRDQTDGYNQGHVPEPEALHESYSRGPHHEQSYSDSGRPEWQDRSRDSLNRNTQGVGREVQNNARDSWGRDPRFNQSRDSIGRDSYAGRLQDNLGRDPRHDNSRDSLGRDPRHDHSRDSLGRDPRHDHSRDSLGRDPRHDHSRDSLGRDPRHDHSRDSLGRDPRHDHSRDSLGRDPRHDHSRDSLGRDPRHDHSRDSFGRDPRFDQSFNSQGRPTHYKSLGNMDRIGADDQSSSFARPLQDGATSSQSMGNLDTSAQGRSPLDDRSSQGRSPHGTFPDNERSSLGRSPREADQQGKPRLFVSSPKEEAQEMRDAYKSIQELQQRQKEEDYSGPNRKKRPELLIHTVKEEPDMLDTDVLETRKLESKNKKYPLNGKRLRMSISAGDLIGKTHDELVLLLIQLRRNQASLEKARDYYRECLEKRRNTEREYRRQRNDSTGHLEESLEENHQSFVDLKRELEEIENKQEVYKPLINLVDNMVTMGSLYGGDNLMLATQYRKHLLRPDQFTEPKVMLEFSRENQEKRFVKEIENEIKQLSTDEVDLEEKLEKLYDLDRKLQEQSFKVTSLKEDKEYLEKALTGILHQQDQFRNNPREMKNLMHRQRTIEKELSLIMKQLAEASQALEETTAENNKIEHEVTLLRTKVNGELTRSRSAPSLVGESARTKMKMEKELAKVQNMMAGLSNEGARLKEAITTLRRSSSGTQLAALLEKESETATTKKKSLSYLITDIDSNETVDASKSSADGSFVGSPYTTVDHRVSQPVREDSVSAAQRTYLTSGPEPQNTNHALSISDQYGSNQDYSVDSDQTEMKRPVIIHQRQESFTTASEEEENDSDNSMIVDPDAPDVTWDISDAEDNTKRFFGIIPKEKSKVLTVRDVKRQHDQRKEREKMRREADDDDDEQGGCYSVSGSKQIPVEHRENQDNGGHDWYSPSVNSSNDNTDTGPLYENLPRARSVPALAPNSSAPTSRRSSIILMAPKPFTRYEDRQMGIVTAKPFITRPFNSELQLNVNTERRFQPVSFNPNANRVSVPFGTQQYYSDMNLNRDTNDNGQITAERDYSSTELPPLAVTSTETQSLLSPVDVQYPWLKSFGQQDAGIYNVKKSPKGRYLTISSTEPVKMETKSWPKSSLHSLAGDLITNKPIDNVPDIVKSSTKKIEMELYDEFTIDRELYRPGPVDIPERYNPESDEEDISEEEQFKRCEKAEKIKKLLAQQSVHSLSQPDISQIDRRGLHHKVEMEKYERSQLLGIGQELARQVTLKSKEAAAKRRKTWSGDQFSEAMKSHENSEALQRDLSPDRQDMYV
ncbi:uncharacterized protein LOC121382369 [Gigantopelta aegis]|uniref:uncharacterized protein LOC121382369 n=1 Tax=Gigantopelta aegis TaxID=1735272 RepID=UPI001B88C7E8|nr:uncharacterized protein LOC121382369 [Gigantopelta aegis]